MEIKLIEKCVDSGWPDLGHQEWFLVRYETRQFLFLQKLLGYKEITLMCYGENKPSDEKVSIDIKLYSSQESSRCCGRCDGINDLCIADTDCEKHNTTGCRICWP